MSKFKVFLLGAVCLLMVNCGSGTPQNQSLVAKGTVARGGQCYQAVDCKTTPENWPLLCYKPLDANSDSDSGICAPYQKLGNDCEIDEDTKKNNCQRLPGWPLVCADVWGNGTNFGAVCQMGIGGPCETSMNCLGYAAENGQEANCVDTICTKIET